MEVLASSADRVGEPLFCTWSEALGKVGGPALEVADWAKVRRGLTLAITPTDALRVQSIGWGKLAVSLVGDSDPPMLLRSVGLRNRVELLRHDGAVLARFPMISKDVYVDLEGLGGSERALFLAVLGSGLVRRARRFGVLIA